jgi:hypothetical protein
MAARGLESIPFEKVEVIFNAPPHIVHNNRAAHDGLGDVAFLVKYRLLSANEQHGNYILTAFLGWSLPTGEYSNGSLHAVLTPTIAYGKGLKDFDVQGTFGIALPTSDTNIVGRSYLWNNTFQYRFFRKFWPEIELNSTFFQDGPRDGMKQNFVTPGLVIGRLHLWRRVGFMVGGGYQIATTHLHANSHNGTLSIRFPFYRGRALQESLQKFLPHRKMDYDFRAYGQVVVGRQIFQDTITGCTRL